jgi:lysophospholipase L1-like esterase
MATAELVPPWAKLVPKFEECQKKIEYVEECLYQDVKGTETVLLLGDSHTLVAFETIAEFNARYGVNTLALSSHIVKRKFNATLEEHLASLEYRLSRLPTAIYSSISRVFIIERGVLRLKGKDVDGVKNQNYWAPYGAENLYRRLQYLTDYFRKDGKKVFIVEENPIWPVHIRNRIVLQPFRPNKSSFILHKQDVLNNQKEYLNLLAAIHGAKIIRTVDAFCPENTCLSINRDGLPLYYDTGHLSGAGNRFLLEHVLKPYLEKAPPR